MKARNSPATLHRIRKSGGRETIAGLCRRAFCFATSATAWLVLVLGIMARAGDPLAATEEEWRLRELASPEMPVSMQNQLSVHGLFSDGMVLQRDMPVPVWGWGPEGAEVEVSFADACVKTRVSGHRWSVSLPALRASAQGRDLSVVCGTRCLVFKDVLVGDVWLCSGQSNMQVEMKLDTRPYPRRASDMAATRNPLVRFYKVDRASSRAPRRDVPPVRNDLFEPWSDAFLGNQWRPCTEDWTPHVSAVAFYFARELQPRLGCPLGMLICARGATSIWHWVPAEVINGEDCWQDCRRFLSDTEAGWAKFIGSYAAP